MNTIISQFDKKRHKVPLKSNKKITKKLKKSQKKAKKA